MRAFDPNDYRKRVLAAVERRGGIEHSDVFELYDIPLEEAARLSDAEIAARVEEVWGFWQKQRDHPKYRVLVGLLVDEHDELSAPLRTASSRRVEAERVTQIRARRDAERYEMIDTAIDRLVERHGGIPAGKVPGLEDIGKMSGLSASEIAARVRRHRIIDEVQAAPVPAAAGVSTQRRQQIRKLLAEFERLQPGDPVPTLLALLRLDFSKARETSEIRLRAEALRARARELPPGRTRVVLDELLVHISDLLEAGGSAVDDYLRAVTDDVTEMLRPQVAAAVLVEDHLVAADFDYLLGEGMAAGLDRATAERVLIGLTDELGTTVEGREHLAGSGSAQRNSGASTRTDGPGGVGSRAGSDTTGRTSGPAQGGAGSTAGGQRAGAYGGDNDSGAGSTSRGGSTAGGTIDRSRPQSRPWEAPLRAARAALRAGHPREAARHVDLARRNVGGDSLGMTSVRPMAEEVDRILAEAAAHWRGATSGIAGRRFMEVLEHLEFLQRKASDVPNPAGSGPELEQLLTQARGALADADRQFAAAPATPPAARMRALLAVLEACTDHAGAIAALAELPVTAPGQVTASRKPDGTVVITWTPSATEQVEYRVTRLLTDGSWRVVGRTRGTALEDGGTVTGPVPVYGVVASVSGRNSEVRRSDGDSRAEVAPPAAPGAPNLSGMPTVTRLTVRDGLLTFEWPTGITEVMLVARADAPPTEPDDPQARKWKVTNSRYQIDGGARIPADLPRPCHLAVASCKRDATGTLAVAAGFAPDARIRWVG
ncbi:Ig-like domain repeat protein [Nocardia sp. NPDC051030]|uniref:Ig-like domain repeat protein n=1 Tax=Nocardia sp. NPDC051030 TaxID=3155162 RepID=UPI00343D176D